MADLKTKSKPRRLGFDAKAENNDQKLNRLVVSTYVLNKENNACAKAYKEKRKELLGFMKNNNIESTKLEGVEINGTTISLEALLETPVQETGDVEKLYKLIGHEAFMKLVKVTKTDVVAAAGAAVWEQIKGTKTGEENVTVSLLDA